jgi:hypothetical protein
MGRGGLGGVERSQLRGAPPRPSSLAAGSGQVGWLFSSAGRGGPRSPTPRQLGLPCNEINGRRERKHNEEVKGAEMVRRALPDSVEEAVFCERASL